MRNIETYDRPSLEAFHTELIEAGFEPVTDPRDKWIGPIHSAFGALTEANNMAIIIRDGWPIIFPILFVEGLHTNHLTEEGYVCMWHEGDGSQEWNTLDGFFARIEQWCTRAKQGWDSRGLARDAYLNFKHKHRTIATFNIEEFNIGESGHYGKFHGVQKHSLCIMLKPGKSQQSENLQGYWYSLERLEITPRNLDETLKALRRSQSRALCRNLDKRKHVA